MTMIRKAIKEALAAQKISQRRCAIDNEIDYTSFNKFINNQRPLPLADIEKVFQYLKLKVTPSFEGAGLSGEMFKFKTSSQNDLIIFDQARIDEIMVVGVQPFDDYNLITVETGMDFASFLQFMDEQGVSESAINSLLSPDADIN